MPQSKPSGVRPLVVHESDIEFEGGADVRWRTLLSGYRTLSEKLTLGIADVPAGGEVPKRHYHPQPEAYYLIEGTGLLEIDSETFEMRPGHAAFIPGGSIHRLRNTGSSPLKLLYVFPADTFGEVEYTFPDEV